MMFVLGERRFGPAIGILGMLIFAAVAAAIVKLVPRHAKWVGWTLAAVGILFMTAAPVISYSRGHNSADETLVGLLLASGFVIACLAGHILVRVRL